MSDGGVAVGVGSSSVIQNDFDSTIFDHSTSGGSSAG